MNLQRDRVTIKNLLPKGKHFSHLKTNREIILKKDTDFDILCFEIKFEGYYPTLVCL